MANSFENPSFNRPEEPNDESGEHEKALHEVNLGEIFKSVKEYTDKFGAAGKIGRALEGKIEHDDLFDKENLEQAAFMETLDTYRQDLAMAGLSMRQVSAGAPEHLRGEISEAFFGSTLAVHVTSGKNFLHYLDSLDKEYLSYSQIKGLDEMARILASKMRGSYGDKNNSDEKIEIFNNLEAFIEQYEYLGATNKKVIGQELIDYKKVLPVIKGKYWNEFLLANRAHLLYPPDFNSVGSRELWHDKSSPEILRSFWNKALDTVRTIGKNPNALDLQKRVISNLKAVIKNYKKHLRDQHIVLLLSKEKRRGFNNVLIEVYNELIQLER